MAQGKLNPREFIVNTFSPQVAAVCSNQAEAICQKNNLSFIELLQPFCRLNCEGHIKDPQGSTVIVRCLQISVRDVNATPPEPSIARKMLNETVSSSFTERTTLVDTGSVNLNIPVSIPWFEAWRDTFLDVQYPSDHEFTKHFLACMIVVSTSDDEPLEMIQQMTTKLNQSIPGKLPKWFNNNVLRYYILIHDITHQEHKKKAEEAFKEMKNIYGVNNCFLLQMNSRPPGQIDDNNYLPDPWSQFIVKNVNVPSGSGQNSSPCTPADTSGVSVMPNQVNIEHEKKSNAETPKTPQQAMPTFSSADFADSVSISSQVSEPTVLQLEVGQEAIPTTIHPLSPIMEISGNFIRDDSKMHVDDSPINANVWADSPGQSAIQQHGSRLDSDDLERLRTMISDFCLKSLLPYVERQIGLLNDVISNKKGVSRSLFSATKRWFGTSKPGVPGSIPANVVIYTAESPELQLRRLADLCFMFGHYGLAYQAYHNAKRDFAADQAWLYYAGALEMAALSAFMQDEMTRKTIEYMDDAILTYLNTCKMPQFATRATLLSAECLKNRGLYADAAKQLIRMTSEESDLRSALLLEQAAYCFLGPKMIRKYAFHIVIAGHRFSKAGQKKHSLRCYQQAYQVYYGKGWSFAEDHIHFTLGRQAVSLKLTTDAVKVFEKLLNPNSKQPALQQAAFLREYLHINNAFSEEPKTEEETFLAILPLPLINANQIKVLPGPVLKPGDNSELISQISLLLQDSEDNSWWSKLEEHVLMEAQGFVPMIFKPSILIYSDLSNNSSKPNVIIDEPIYFSIELSNPLQIPLPLSEITLIWSFQTENNEIITNETEFFTSENKRYTNVIETQTIENFLLQPSSKQDLVLFLKPKTVGNLKVLGLAYKLSILSDFNDASLDQAPNSNLFVRGKRLFEIKGPKIKNVKEKSNANIYKNDYRLDMNVVEKAPFMEISYTKLSPEMLCGEMQKVELTLKNIGNAPLTNIYVGSTNPKLISFSSHKSNINYIKKTKGKLNMLVTKISLQELNIEESSKTIFWVRAPHEKGNHRLDLLFYYENAELKINPKYRTSRHSWHLTVLDSIQINAVARTSATTSFTDRSPTLNLTVRVKNMNRVHDPFINEINLMNVAFQSKNWSLLNNTVFPAHITKVQPQETAHLLLKLKRNSKTAVAAHSEDNLRNCKDSTLEENSEIVSKNELYSIVSLQLFDENKEDFVTNSPYLNFIENRNISVEILDNLNEQQPSKKELKENPILSTMHLDSTLIVRWKAKVMENGVIVRDAVGQHHIDMKILNKCYNQPAKPVDEPIEYGARLKIFGPDANVSTRTLHVKTDRYWEADCEKHLIWYSLDHVKYVNHDFKKNRICSLPVLMLMHNNSHLGIDVKINTIGTSSQTHLPNIKSQLYTPQASTFYRYAGHTAVECNMEPFGYRSIKLQVIIPASGTYDLASRIDVSVRHITKGEFMPQKWNIESICVINSENS